MLRFLVASLITLNLIGCTVVERASSGDIQPETEPIGQTEATSTMSQTMTLSTEHSVSSDLLPEKGFIRFFDPVAKLSETEQYYIGRLYEVRSDGANLRIIGEISAAYDPVSWSPDGTMVAYVAEEPDPEILDRGIYILNIISNQTQELVIPNYTNLGPVWSPDGSWIALLTETAPNYGSELFIVSPDGTRREQLTSDSRGGYNFSWSPLGNKLAFRKLDRDFTEPGKRYHLYTIDIDTSELQQLTDNRLPGNIISTAWSPDGEHIAVTICYIDDDNCPGNANYDVFLVEVNSGDLTQLTDHPSKDMWPAWSPSGEQLAFVSERDGYPAIYILEVANPDNIYQVTDESVVPGAPTWFASSVIDGE